jgi:sialic acid synthase SpsE
MRIAERNIGQNERPYVIAELGVNHDGSLERALQLTDAAADAGVDAIKLQLFRAEMLMSRASVLAAYQKSAGERDPIAMLKRLELSNEQMRSIVERAHARKLHAIVTVFSLELVPEAERLGFDAYKTASPDVIHKPLLQALSATDKPLIISTGAATLDEVVRACEWLTGARKNLAFLQCVSSYPTPIEGAELGGIAALALTLPTKIPIGYSDHTSEVETGAEAVRLGACVLEKHMTYDRNAPGPDHAASLEPAQMRRYAAAARVATRTTWPKDLPREKRLTDRERDVRHVSRQSIVSVRDLRAGEALSRRDVTFKRPGTGIEPFHIADVVGQKLVRDVRADTPITREDLPSGVIA